MILRAARLLAACVVLVAMTPRSANAYPFGPGSSVLVHEHEVYVQGVLVEKSSRAIPVATGRPTFFGYTLPGVLLDLWTVDGRVRTTVASASTGYWVYTVEHPLPRGTYRLHIRTRDATGQTGPDTIAATFRVAQTAARAPSGPIATRPAFFGVNALTLSIGVWAGVAALCAAYVGLRRVSLR